MTEQEESIILNTVARNDPFKALDLYIDFCAEKENHERFLKLLLEVVSNSKIRVYKRLKDVLFSVYDKTKAKEIQQARQLAIKLDNYCSLETSFSIKKLGELTKNCLVNNYFPSSGSEIWMIVLLSGSNRNPHYVEEEEQELAEKVLTKCLLNSLTKQSSVMRLFYD